MPEFGPNNYRFKGQAKIKVEWAFDLALQEVGAMIVQDLRETVGVPVEGSGRNAIRSQPGEPPRCETRKLQRRFRFKASREGVGPNQQLVSVWNTDVKAKWLEKGTRRMKPRPFLSPVRQRWQKKIKRVIRTKMAERMKT